MKPVIFETASLPTCHFHECVRMLTVSPAPQLEAASLLCVTNGAWKAFDAVNATWAMAHLDHQPGPRCVGWT